MADLLVTVGRIVELAWSIKKAVETVRHNEEECRVIEKRVCRVSRLIRRFHEEVTEATSSRLSGDLEDLVEALDSALKLVTECQKQRRRLSRFIAPGGIADKLRRVQAEISDATMTILFALNVRATVILENIQNGVHRPPPAPQPQHPVVQSAPPPTMEYDEEEEEDSAGGLRTMKMTNTMAVQNGELLNAADHGTIVLFDHSKDEVTEASTQVEVKQAGNGPHSTSVHEISRSSETVTIAREQTGLKLTARIQLKYNWPNGGGALDISSGSTNTTEKDENATEFCGSVYVEGEPNVFGCLSNFFAFFMPTGCCFNIFRIFKRSDVNQVQVQHPSAAHETSKNLGSWLLSYFQRVDNPKIPPGYADSLNEPLLSGSQNTNDKTSSVEDSSSSLHGHATVGEAEQLNKPLLAGFHFSAGRNNQAFSEFHGTTSSSVAVHTSSSSQNETGLFTQTDGAEQEQNIPSLLKLAEGPQPSNDSKGPIPHIVVPVLLGNETPPARTSLSILSASAAATTHFKQFSLSKLEDATQNFLEDKIIGRGSFATVYKGVLHDGTVVAIKKIQCSYKLSKHMCDILSHVSKLEHKNRVRLLGHGYRVAKRAEGLQDEKDYLFLVEEHMPNGSLDRIIYVSQLDWSSRLSLIQRIAHGLHYLHEQQIIHLDLKPNNILINYEMNPKTTDFGRARMLDQGDDVATRDTDYLLAGTMGYMPPEYIMEGIVSKMYDVYSFGVTLVEIISGMCRWEPVHRQASIEWAWAAREAGRMEELLDLSLCFEPQLNEARRCLEIGLLCTQSDRADRPNMVDVVEMLESKKELPTPKQPKYTKGGSA